MLAAHVISHTANMQISVCFFFLARLWEWAKCSKTEVKARFLTEVGENFSCETKNGFHQFYIMRHNVAYTSFL